MLEIFDLDDEQRVEKKKRMKSVYFNKTCLVVQAESDAQQ